MDKEEPDRTCFNCNHFFPAVMYGPTKLGICLNDKEFEPFIDELLGDSNYACCQDLIDCKKFNGNRDACSDFIEIDMEECIEIDEDTQFGRELISYLKNGQFNSEKLEELLLREQIRNIDFKTLPVDTYAKELKSPLPKKRDAAISSLGSLIYQGNKEAFHELFKFLKQLPTPKTVEDAHLKKNVLRYFESLEYTEFSEFRSLLTKFILDELYNTPSNNTTRQWISAILKFLERSPREEISDPLENMLRENRFSYRLKKRIKDILEDDCSIL